MIRRTRDRVSRRAFSLFEAMLAVVLVASLSGAVFTFLFNLGRQRDGVESATDALRGASALIEAIEGDALGVIAGDAGAGSGVVGDETSLTLLTRGIAPPVLGARAGRTVGDLQGVEYRFAPDSGSLSARRWNAGDAQGQEQSAILATGVARLRLRYFDGTAWKGSFDSRRDAGLPVAIEVAIWFGIPDGLEGSDTAPEPTAPESQTSESLSGFPDALPDDLAVAPDSSTDPDAEPLPPPDRVRIIVIPDGPVSAWRDGQ